MNQSRLCEVVLFRNYGYSELLNISILLYNIIDYYIFRASEKHFSQITQQLLHPPLPNHSKLSDAHPNILFSFPDLGGNLPKRLSP